jgi:hypothetical protein
MGGGPGSAPGPAGGHENEVVSKNSGDTPPEGFTDLMARGAMGVWQARFTVPYVEKRMTWLRRRRLQRLADLDMAVHWKTYRGVLSYDGRGKNIRTVAQYCDFELYIDWKIAESGNGAIYLRSLPAIKMWDTSLEHLGADVGSGGLYNNRTHPSKPAVKADRPVGEWNRFYIKMVGDRVTVKLNDQLVVDDVVLENHTSPGVAVPARGRIELEGNRSPIQFRNIFIRELP